MPDSLFIWRFDVRSDVSGHPNQIYALEIEGRPFTTPREISLNMHSSMVPMTIEEMADSFEKTGKKLRELAEQDRKEPPVDVSDFNPQGNA